MQFEASCDSSLPRDVLLFTVVELERLENLHASHIYTKKSTKFAACNVVALKAT